MNLRELSPVQWVGRLVRRGFASSPAETEPPEAVPCALTAQDIQSRLAARGILLRSTLRVLWMRPSGEGDERELVHPFAKAPLSAQGLDWGRQRCSYRHRTRQLGGRLQTLD